MAVQSEKEIPKGRINILLLLAFVLTACSYEVAAQAEDFSCWRIAVLNGEPLQMQWNYPDGSVLITLESNDVVRHITVKALTDTVFSTLDFDRNPRYLAAHPSAKVWAGALSDGKPWSMGNYRFLSRFGQRKVFLRQPSFNIAGNLLAFSAYTPYNKDWRLMTYDLKYDNLNEMRGLPSGISYPVWSPKGTFIGFVLPSDHPVRKQAAMVRWDGTDLRFFSSDTLSYEYISWLGSEQYLILTAKGDEQWYIIRHLIGKGNQEIVHTSRSALRFAQMLPGTGKIAFLQENQKRWEFWLLDLERPD
jgi:hypothetical protein